MTKIYFVRHAEPNYENHDDFNRELTARGCADSKKIAKYLQDKHITAFYSSPYKRAIDTVKEAAQAMNKPVHEIDDLRERKISEEWIADFSNFSERQWKDFDYKLKSGESLSETQDRNIRVINEILDKHVGENIVIGTHATALSATLNSFDIAFDYNYFQKIKGIFPFVVECQFENKRLISAQTISEFEEEKSR